MWRNQACGHRRTGGGVVEEPGVCRRTVVVGVEEPGVESLRSRGCIEEPGVRALRSRGWSHRVTESEVVRVKCKDAETQGHEDTRDGTRGRRGGRRDTGTQKVCGNAEGWDVVAQRVTRGRKWDGAGQKQMINQ